ncbi:hypothetical protein C5S39_03575, partial [Candidatus Methanophagaceae archaeon]
MAERGGPTAQKQGERRGGRLWNIDTQHLFFSADVF